MATAPKQVCCPDLTFLPAHIAGQWFFLYLILDLYSHRIIGFEAHDTADDGDHAAHLLRRTALAEGLHAQPAKPVLHGDNGATLKATTVPAMLHWLGVRPSYSRPRVSNDNPFVEALFRTAKYRPASQAQGVDTLDEARAWAAQFVRWYNHEHRHSGIDYVTPAQRHSAAHHAVLAARHALYTQARQANPRRWSRHTRNWPPRRPSRSIPSATQSSKPMFQPNRYVDWRHDSGDNDLNMRLGLEGRLVGDGRPWGAQTAQPSGMNGATPTTAPRFSPHKHVREGVVTGHGSKASGTTPARGTQNLGTHGDAVASALGAPIERFAARITGRLGRSNSHSAMALMQTCNCYTRISRLKWRR